MSSRSSAIFGKHRVGLCSAAHSVAQPYQSRSYRTTNYGSFGKAISKWMHRDPSLVMAID